MKNKNSEEYIEDEIDLAVLVKALFQGKWIVIGFTSLASIIVVIYSLSLSRTSPIKKRTLDSFLNF